VDRGAAGRIGCAGLAPDFQSSRRGRHADLHGRRRSRCREAARSRRRAGDVTPMEGLRAVRGPSLVRGFFFGSPRECAV